MIYVKKPAKSATRGQIPTRTQPFSGNMQHVNAVSDHLRPSAPLRILTSSFLCCPKLILIQKSGHWSHYKLCCASAAPDTAVCAAPWHFRCVISRWVHVDQTCVARGANLSTYINIPYIECITIQSSSLYIYYFVLIIIIKYIIIINTILIIFNNN